MSLVVIIYHFPQQFYTCYKTTRPISPGFCILIEATCLFSLPQPLRPPANFIHSICSDSDSSWDKFNKYISFCNKSHIVLGKISAGFFYYCVRCCSNNQSTCSLWIIGECTCGSGCCTVLNTYICLFFTIHTLQRFSVGYRLCVGSTSICHSFGRQSGELFVI